MLKVGDNLTVFDTEEIEGIPYYLLTDDDGHKYDVMSEGDQDLIREGDNIVQYLESVLHQLSTDADLENVTAAETYSDLVEQTKALLYRLDPSNPQLQRYHPDDDNHVADDDERSYGPNRR